MDLKTRQTIDKPIMVTKGAKISVEPETGWKIEFFNLDSVSVYFPPGSF